MSATPRFSKSEMMIVAAARELAGQRVCFVGVGLPNIAVNLAKRTVAPGPRARLRGGRLRGAAGAAAAVASATRRSSPARPRSTSMFELFSFYLQGGLIDVGFLGAAQIDRFGNINTTVIGDYDDADDAAAGQRRRVRDRDQRPRGVRDHAPVEALVRRADRLPDVRREPRRRGGLGADPARAGLARARAVGRRHGPRDLALRRDRRDAPRLAPSRARRSTRSARRSAGSRRFAATLEDDAGARPPRSSA